MFTCVRDESSSWFCYRSKAKFNDLSLQGPDSRRNIVQVTQDGDHTLCTPCAGYHALSWWRQPWTPCSSTKREQGYYYCRGEPQASTWRVGQGLPSIEIQKLDCLLSRRLLLLVQWLYSMWCAPRFFSGLNKETEGTWLWRKVSLINVFTWLKKVRIPCLGLELHGVGFSKTRSRKIELTAASLSKRLSPNKLFSAY